MGTAAASIARLTEPWWKFWIGQAERAAATDALLAQGASAVPELVAHYRKRSRGWERVLDVLVRMEAPGIKALAEAVSRGADPAEMQGVADLFRDLGPKAASAAPVLLRWASYTRDPRLEAGRHLTGDAALDARLSAAAGLGAASGMEATVMAWVREAAADALRAMGTELRPHLDELRSLARRPELDDKYDTFKGRIREAIVAAEKAAAG